MKGLFNRIVARATGTLPVAQPRAVTRYEQPGLNADVFYTETRGASMHIDQRSASCLSDNTSIESPPQMHTTVADTEIRRASTHVDKRNTSCLSINASIESSPPMKIETGMRKSTLSIDKHSLENETPKKPELPHSRPPFASPAPKISFAPNKIELHKQLLSEQQVNHPTILKENVAYKEGLIGDNTKYLNREPTVNVSSTSMSKLPATIDSTSIRNEKKEFPQASQNAGAVQSIMSTTIQNETLVKQHKSLHKETDDNASFITAPDEIEPVTPQNSGTEKSSSKNAGQTSLNVSSIQKKKPVIQQNNYNSQTPQVMSRELLELSVPTVTINIGTIDVRKQKTEPVKQSKPSAPPSRTMSLGNYLQKRKTGEL